MSLSRRAWLAAACALPVAHAARAQLPPEALGTRDAIVPVLRSFIGLEPEKLRRVQNITPYNAPGAGGDHAPVIEQFVGDLHVRYGFTSAKGVVHLVRAIDLKLLEVKREEIFALALANLRKRYPGLRVEQPNAPLSRLVGGARDVEASVMLDAAFWERNHRGRDIIAGCPARDTLIFTAVPSEERLEDLRLEVQTAYAKAGRTALSRYLYIWNNRRWAVFET